MTLEARACSLKPAPDMFLGQPRRVPFLEAVRRTGLSVAIQALPSDPRHLEYMRRAERNRKRVAAERAPQRHCTTAVAEPPENLCVDASAAAYQRLNRRGLPWWAEREDMLNVGCLAILEAGARNKALAVTVAYREMLDYLKGERVRQRDREHPSSKDQGPGIPSDIDGRQGGANNRRRLGRDAAVWDAVKALPIRQQRAMILYLSGGCGYEEIAVQTGETPAAINGLLARARENIKDFLTHNGSLGVGKSTI